MGSVPSASSASDFSAVFRAHLDADGTMAFDRFMQLALYHPQSGYYLRPKTRIGYGAGTDFFTATTSGPVFGELVAAAAVTLLRGHDPADFAFVEIGAEPGGGVLKDVHHPFGQVVTTGIAAKPDLRGRCVVFSNELFDAQPFRRLIRKTSGWCELGVAERGGQLVEVERAHVSDSRFPDAAPEGYRLDVPQAATELTATIAGQPWSGLFLAFDYGKSWQELSRHTPNGTARAYYHHTQVTDLLLRPGEQDLTCHICWDWLGSALTNHGFPTPRLESQEAFFMGHASAHLERVMQAEAGAFSPRKRSLMQLLHPAHLGQKFQVLHAWRDEVQNSP